jgi:hypothetical protein
LPGKRRISNDAGRVKSFFLFFNTKLEHTSPSAHEVRLSLPLLFLCVTLTCSARLLSSTQRTPKRGLRQADFVFDGDEIRGLEQNPETKSRWAQLARSGIKVMQFLNEGRYMANVVDGKVTRYGKAR